MRTIIVTLILLLSACGSGQRSNAGFRITSLHGGPGLKGSVYVTCANRNTEFNVYVAADKIRKLRVGDTCPSGRRW